MKATAAISLALATPCACRADPWRRLVACGLLVTHLAACTSWRVEQVTPEQLLSKRAPAELRITRVDRSRIVLGVPKVSGDSIIGVADVGPSGVPMGDIAMIATRHTDVLKTVGLMVGVAFAVGVFVYTVSPPCYLGCH